MRLSRKIRRVRSGRPRKAASTRRHWSPASSACSGPTARPGAAPAASRPVAAAAILRHASGRWPGCARCAGGSCQAPPPGRPGAASRNSSWTRSAAVARQPTQRLTRLSMRWRWARKALRRSARRAASPSAGKASGAGREVGRGRASVRTAARSRRRGGAMGMLSRPANDNAYHQYREAGDDETPCGSRAGLPGTPPLTSPGAHPGCSAPGAWPAPRSFPGSAARHGSSR